MNILNSNRIYCTWMRQALLLKLATVSGFLRDMSCDRIREVRVFDSQRVTVQITTVFLRCRCKSN